MESHLVVSAVGKDKQGLVDKLSHTILECGCNIHDTRMAVMGEEFSILFLLSGNWNAIAKFENALPRLEENLELSVQTKRTSIRASSSDAVPYGVEVVALDHPGIVNDIANFFYRRDINIEDLFTSTYQASHTGALMFSLHMTVAIHADVAIAAIRGEFMDFCDDRNLDAMLAPVK